MRDYKHLLSSAGINRIRFEGSATLTVASQPSSLGAPSYYLLVNNRMVTDAHLLVKKVAPKRPLQGIDGCALVGDC